MLPSIIDIANQHNLTLLPPKATSKEVLGKCPFCRADEGKKGKFYLSLNQRDNVFRCWHCGEKGGVCRLESLLTGIPESEITDKYRVKPRRTIHPAERLTAAQLQLIGFKQKPNWMDMKKRNTDYYKRTRDWVWLEWQEFVKVEKRKAFTILLVAIFENQSPKGMAYVQEREAELGEPLLNELLQLFSQPKWPQWAIESKHYALSLTQQDSLLPVNEQDRVEPTAG
ncbi:ZnF_CHCC domain-containing protein [Brevibacillus sp. IT-7CA2]|uniref:hypothetical protein n=1 Tax=Brevibacillus sp. IT-7CA2 TaxID=3026436 RepID=UPI0039E07BBE